MKLTIVIDLDHERVRHECRIPECTMVANDAELAGVLEEIGAEVVEDLNSGIVGGRTTTGGGPLYTWTIKDENLFHI